MANLGQLETFLDDDAIHYELDGKPEKFLFPVEAVLRFYANMKALSEEGVTHFDRLTIYELAAPIFGSKWNMKTATFTGGLLAELLKKDMPFTVIDRMVSAVFVKLQFEDDELAEAMFRLGSLPKALREQAERKKQEAEAEKLTVMNAADSDTQTA